MKSLLKCRPGDAREIGPTDLRSSSRDGSCRCSRSAGMVSSCPTSFPIGNRARPVFDSGIHALGIALFEAQELLSNFPELFDIGFHLGQTPPYKDFGVPAGAPAPISHVKQLFNVAETQSHLLKALDKAEPLGGRLAVESVARGAAPSWMQESDPLVVTQGVGPKAERPGQLGNGRHRHAPPR